MPHARISDRVSEQLLRICSRNSARAAIPLMLSILLTSLILANKVDSQLLQLWVLASSSVIVIRVALLRVVARNEQLPQARKRLVATLLTLFLGCTIGSVLYFFPLVGSFERAMLTAILLGLCTASHSTNFGYRPLLLSYIGPLLGTLGMLWIANIDELMHPALAAAVGASVLIVGLTLLINGKFMFDAFALSIESSIKLEEQSRHLSEALDLAEQAKREAEASSQSKTRFIAAASHDLRQPVHVLNMLGATMAREELNPRPSEIVKSMNIAVTSLSSQLNALLDISELDSGSIKPVIRSVNLSALIDELKVEMIQLASDKRIELIAELPPDLYVRTDPAMLAQIIRNLCGNAIKYTFTGHVRIAATPSPSLVTLSVSDTGIGINDNDCSKVFEEFYQVSNPGRDKSRGMGLGLSIVERLIRNLGHTIALSSSIGRGTHVSISLKRCTEEQVASSASMESESAREINLPNGFWVHLVEDEDAVQRSVELFLQSVGCKVTMTASSKATFRFLSKHVPAAMLIDLRLQDTDSGLKVVDWVSEKHPDLPIAIVTGEPLSDGLVAQAYPDIVMLQKPVSNDDLLALLDYMASSAKDSETLLTTTSLELN